MTEMRKAANRMDFNKPEDEFIDGDEIVGLGLLGSKEGSGRLRLVAAQQKQKLTAKVRTCSSVLVAGPCAACHMAG